MRELVDRVCAPRRRRAAAPRRCRRRWRAAASPLAAPLYRLRGRRPPISPDQLDSLARHWAFDDARARTELDWQPRGLDEGLPPTVEFLLAARAAEAAA